MSADMGGSIQLNLARIQADAASLAMQAPAPNELPQDGGNAGVDFADAFKQAIRSVDAKDQDAADKMAAVESGRSDDLVGAMLSSQEASLSFSMLMQVRNKVVGAVDELIKLQF